MLSLSSIKTLVSVNIAAKLSIPTSMSFFIYCSLPPQNYGIKGGGSYLRATNMKQIATLLIIVIFGVAPGAVTAQERLAGAGIAAAADAGLALVGATIYPFPSATPLL